MPSPLGNSCPALVGPTAVGKTELVLGLAAEYPLEVISLDSRQIYAGLRIGTAQPSDEERAACPHHLVDFLPPTDTYSAQRFRNDVLEVMAGIRARGNTPLLVGGAGMYLHGLQEGFLDYPFTDEELAAVRTGLDALDDQELRQRLREEDEASWERIAPADRYRSQRALEILILTGKPLSTWREEHVADPAGGLEYPVVVLERSPRELDARIIRRTEAMLTGGWIAETTALLERWGPDAPGLATLGYRQIVAHLREGTDLKATREEIVLRTRQYAKRQRTWFRPRPAVVRGKPEDPELRDTLRRLLEAAAPS